MIKAWPPSHCSEIVWSEDVKVETLLTWVSHLIISADLPNIIRKPGIIVLNAKFMALWLDGCHTTEFIFPFSFGTASVNHTFSSVFLELAPPSLLLGGYLVPLIWVVAPAMKAKRSHGVPHSFPTPGKWLLPVGPSPRASPWRNEQSRWVRVQRTGRVVYQDLCFWRLVNRFYFLHFRTGL